MSTAIEVIDKPIKINLENKRVVLVAREESQCELYAATNKIKYPVHCKCMQDLIGFNEGLAVIVLLDGNASMPNWPYIYREAKRRNLPILTASAFSTILGAEREKNRLYDMNRRQQQREWQQKFDSKQREQRKQRQASKQDS